MASLGGHTTSDEATFADDDSDAIPVAVSDEDGVEDTHLTTGSLVADRYRVERVLGSGGMGTVVAARDMRTGQTVAVKVMHAAQAKNADARRRFVREGRSAARLESEHTVRIHEVGTLPSGLPYIAMEYLDGEDLEEIQTRRELSVEEVLDYVLQATIAISEAHASGLVHRDLKPQNLFLARQRDGSTKIKVLDFGLAKELERREESDGSSVTTDNMLLGSPHFMSPEQVRTPGQVDGRTDIWALGATLYHLLTGDPPFVSPTMFGLLARIMTDPAPHVKERRPEVPGAVDAVIVRCLERDPDARATMGELVTALQNARASLRPGPTGAASASAMATMPTEAMPMRPSHRPMPLEGGTRGKTLSMHDFPSAQLPPVAPSVPPAARASMAPGPAAPQAAPVAQAPVRPSLVPPLVLARPKRLWPWVLGAVVLTLAVVGATLAFAIYVTRPH